MALDLIDQDLARRWTLADLSHEVFVGSFHLAHEFKRWVGATLGWPEPASFSRHFRKAFGASPREYRRRRDQREGT